MTNQKGEKPNYIGTLVLFLLMMFAFIKYDDFSSTENIENVRVKRQIATQILNYINKTTIGYYIARGTILLIALYLLRNLFIILKKR